MKVKDEIVQGVCRIEGCSSSTAYRGMCSKHYEQARRVGSLDVYGAPVDSKKGTAGRKGGQANKGKRRKPPVLPASSGKNDEYMDGHVPMDCEGVVLAIQDEREEILRSGQEEIDQLMAQLDESRRKDEIAQERIQQLQEEKDEIRKNLDAYDSRLTLVRVALDKAGVPDMIGGCVISQDSRVNLLAADRDKAFKRTQLLDEPAALPAYCQRRDIAWRAGVVAGAASYLERTTNVEEVALATIQDELFDVAPRVGRNGGRMRRGGCF